MSHEDCDAFEPTDEVLQARIEGAMRPHIEPFHAVVPAWELEAWWFICGHKPLQPLEKLGERLMTMWGGGWVSSLKRRNASEKQ
jgi:hypothetical protein